MASSQGGVLPDGNGIITTEVAPAGPKLYGKAILSLENCLYPKQRLESSPSTLDGLSKEDEADLRIVSCELIQAAGILLRLPQVAMATGQVLFHRFFYSKSFVKYNYEVVAMGCVCLASKIEEAPRRIRDVINVFNHIKQLRNQKTIAPVVLDQSYINLKNQVIKAERRVLKELGFCVHVKHPHKIIVMYLQVLECKNNQQLTQLSWNYMNDSLRTDVFLRHNPETIACACIYLSARQLKLPLPNNPPWYLLFQVNEEDIRSICMTILRLYKRTKPAVEKLEKALEELKAAQEEAKLLAKGIANQDANQNKVGGGFSPNSRSNSPGKDDKTAEDANNATTNDNGTSKNSDGSSKLKDKDKNSVIDGNNTSINQSSGTYNRDHSRSPNHNSRKSRSSPINHKDSSSKSRHRSRSRSTDRKKSHRRSTKRNRSRSSSPSRIHSPRRNHKKGHKDKLRYRSQSRDRSNYRSRSRSYEKHNSSSSKSKKSRVKDVGRRRSRSQDRGRSHDHSRR